MKILHVVQGYYPAIGGTEWLIQRLSEELVRQFQDDGTVFTTDCLNGEGFFKPGAPRLKTGWEERAGVKIRRFPVQRGISGFLRKVQFLPYHLSLPGNQYLRLLASGPLIPELKKAIREHPAEIITSASFPLMHMFTAQRAALETRRPCILVGCLHPADRWGFQRPMIYRAIRKADFYVANTEFEAQYVISKGAEAGQVAVIGAGVDLDFFREISPREAKDRLGIKDQPLIGFIGQVAAAKGIHVLLKAMQEVWRVFPGSFLLIAGASTLFVETLEKMIGQLPGSQQKQIIRRYDFSPEDKPWLFAAIDLLAYPSGYESFGISFVEAWACKKPVIGGRRGAVASLTTGGRDSLLIKHQVYRDLAEAIILLLTNPDWAQRLGAAGFQKAADRYNWPEIARRYRALYHQAGSL